MKHLLLSVFMLLALTVYGQNDGEYEYTVDLTRVENDKLYVELITPDISDKEIIFYMPKIIPGTYRISNYGRFVSQLTAFDKKDRKLEVSRLDSNSWKISNAKKLAKLTYWIEDTYDADQTEVWSSSGTNIEAGKNFVMNTPGFFGYFKGLKDIPFKLNIIRDKNFYGGTGLIPVEQGKDLSIALDKEGEVTSTKKVDIYKTEDYDQLIDSPLMYAPTDTAMLKVANTEVLISTYSPNGVIKSSDIAATISDVLEAQSKFLGGELPVDKYAFIFYFTDQPTNSLNALEHSYSSFYFLPEAPMNLLEQYFRDFAAHEFFHIVTPLTIHSEEIENFDFNDPKMSKHLWLYEGVTEYFAKTVQVKYEIVSPDQYLGMLREKLVTAEQFYDTVPFTDISKYTLDTYQDQYYNVYQKGALIGMSLDILLLELSEGEYGLQNLIAELSEKYGKNQAFQDDQLFSEIEKMTYPEIGEFFSTHVEGPTPINYAEIFEKVGIDYVEHQTFKSVDLGLTNEAIGVDPEKNMLFIGNAEATGEFGQLLGFQDNDVILKINGKEMPAVGPDLGPFIAARRAELIVGDTFSYTVQRGEEEVLLETEVVEIEQSLDHALRFNPTPTEEQLALRLWWLEP